VAERHRPPRPPPQRQESLRIVSNPTTDVAAPKSPPGKGGKPQPPPPIVPDATSAERLALAEKYGLKPLNVRPPLGEYIKDVARRWAFIRVMASSTAYAKNQNNYLGQLWAVLTPILNAAVYVLIFGIVLNVSRGVHNTVAFIVVGIFMFRFVEASVTGGAKSISGKSQLLRSLHFPRAVLPMSSVLSQFATLIPALVVMCGIVLLSGLLPAYDMERVTWWWLLLPVAVLLLVIFNTGIAFMMARLVATTPDLDNVIGFVMRLVMYASGVIFPVANYIDKLDLGGWRQVVVEGIFDYQPVAVYLHLVRSCVLSEETIPQDGLMWALGVFWAVLFFVVGFIVFWRAEERYGRD
jgi:teichoic acid transport system permease protein